MNRNEILTLCCLVLLLATDAALAYTYIYISNTVQDVKLKLQQLPVVGGLIK